MLQHTHSRASEAHIKHVYGRVLSNVEVARNTRLLRDYLNLLLPVNLVLRLSLS